jgi:hypothetical protein
MSLRRNDVLTPKHPSLQLLIFVSLAMIVLSSMIQPTKAAPGLSDRRIYPNWDRRFDHRIRLAKKSFEEDSIMPQHPHGKRLVASGEDEEEEIEHAIEVLLRKYLVSKNDIAKRDYIRLL